MSQDGVEYVSQAMFLSMAVMARITPLYLEGGQFLDSLNRQVAELVHCSAGERLDYPPALMSRAEVVVMNGLDLQVSISRDRLRRCNCLSPLFTKRCLIL